MERVGLVLGLRSSTPLEFWVGVEEGVSVQLDEVLWTKSEKDGVSFYGVVTEVERFIEGTEFVSDDRLVIEGLIPANFAYIAKVSVTRIEPEVYVPPVPGNPVYRADERSLELALYYDQMKRRIPAGISRTGDVVYLNYDFINGREGAHVSISGMSGVATKTSYALFLLNSILQKAEDRNRVHGIIFNVKGKDLLWIDRKSKRFGKKEEELFKRLGLEPRPFTNVGFYSVPESPLSDVPKVKDDLLTGKVKVYRWSMKEFALEGLIRFMFAEGEEGATNIHYVIDRVSERLYRLAKESKSDILTDDYGREISGLGDLVRLLQEVIEEKESGKDEDRYRSWFGTAATATAYAFLRRFHHASSHCKSLVHSTETSRIEWTSHRLTVIDISELHAVAKMFVVGSVLRKIFREKEESGNPYPKIFVVLDELNKYAPKDRWSPIKDILLDIAERGRSLGIILIGAQQTASEVEKRIIANSAVKVTGRLDSAELMSKEYEFLTGNFKQRTMMLKKGTMVLYQPDIPTPMMVNFPIAPWATRKEEVEEEVHVPEEFKNF